MSELQQTVGATIRRERQARDMTLKEFAERAMISVVYLGEIERGKKYPSPVVLERIADALEISVPDLLDYIAQALRGDTLKVAQPIGFRMPEPAVSEPRLSLAHIVNLLEPVPSLEGNSPITFIPRVTDAVA